MFFPAFLQFLWYICWFFLYASVFFSMLPFFPLHFRFFQVNPFLMGPPNLPESYTFIVYIHIGCLPRLTENVTNFSLALGGLIGRNWRVGVVYHCRLNLLVRWQSSNLSSSSGSSFMLFLNQSRR